MPWLQIIMFVLTNLPDIIKIVKMILEAIKKDGALSQAEHKRELLAAIKAFRATGDRRPLEDLLCKLKGDCQRRKERPERGGPK